MRGLRVAALALGLHLAANAVHGVPHAAVPVPLAAWQRAFVLAATFLLPIAALGISRYGRPRAGAWLFAASMTASLAFGLYFHFVAPNPDHVDAVRAGPWRGPFRASAATVALADGVAALVGVWLVARN